MNELSQENFHKSGKCIHCNSRIINNGLHLVCVNCGLVHGDSNIVIENYGKFETYNCSDLVGTCVDSPNRKKLYDKSNKLITSERGRTYGRLRKLDRTAYFQANGHFHQKIQIAKDIGAYLKISPKIVSRILSLYHMLYLKYKDNVNNRVVLLATCFHMIIKQNNMGITFSQLAEAFNIHGHRFSGRLFYQMVLNLNLKVKKNGKVRDYIEKFLTGIYNIKEFQDRLKKKRVYMKKDEYFKKLRHLIYQLIELKTVKEKGHQPDIMAAGIIYFAATIIDRKINGHRILTQDMIGNATGISAYSIRDIYIKIFKPNLKRVLSK